MAEELVGIIGGTGLGDALSQRICQGRLQRVQTPFGRPSAEILLGRLGTKRIAFLNRHGPGHKYSPADVPFAANIFALKKLGVHTVLATGAVGSLRDGIEPGDLVVVDQFIDKTYRRPNSFFQQIAAVHCEMAEPVCGRLRQIVIGAAGAADVKAHSSGTYVCMEGPQFSTRAESLMHRAWGADLIGMTAMPEAKLAREAQMCYALVALVSDYDCWRPHEGVTNEQALLKEILANLQTAGNNCLSLITALTEGKSQLVYETCRCRNSLHLAVWTDQQHISAAEKKMLKVLFD